MTKADLLRKLEGLPLNTPVVFVSWDGEFDLNRAYTVTGRDGLCLVLTQDPLDAGAYPDAEEVVR